MEIDSQLSAKIEELRSLEMNLEQTIMQKQSVQVELNELTNAIEEVKNSDGEVYKILGGIMIKADKEDTLKDLMEKIKLAEMKVKSIEKQEKILETKTSELRKEITESVDKTNKK